jgi:TIR domain
VTAWARSFREGLKELGIDAWIAADEVFPGENFASAVGQALETADAMALLVSPASMASESVGRDLEFALGSLHYEHRVSPVIVQPTAEIPWILVTFSKSPALLPKRRAASPRSWPRPRRPHLRVPAPAELFLSHSTVDRRCHPWRAGSRPRRHGIPGSRRGGARRQTSDGAWGRRYRDC